MLHLENVLPCDRTKMELAITLQRQGWVSKPLKGGSWYAKGSPKTYVLDIARPKSYYEVLVQVEPILSIFPSSEDVLPLVYHGMPSAYYKILLNARDSLCIEKLLAITDSAADVSKLQGTAFKPLVHSDAGGLSVACLWSVCWLSPVCLICAH